MTSLELTKHHGLGNDFLILLDLEDRNRLDASDVRALCDRHRGVGADGVIRVLAGTKDAAVTMELHNADGGAAEMSGNGIRCLAQAVLDAELVDHSSFVVATPDGPRSVSVRPGSDADTVEVSVGMGPGRIGGETPRGIDAEKACGVDMGNPHLVLLRSEVESIQVDELGPEIESMYEGGINVEFVAPGPGADELTLRTWERGAGETLACGTGSAAAAVAARAWGLVGDHVTVHNPGGPLQLDLSGPEVVLTGEAHRIARLEVSLH